MTSDLKPRRAQKRLNIKFYAAISLLILVVYLFFMSASSEAPDVLRKSASAASSITKGIAGTPKEREKQENQASAKDKETHALVNEMQKQSAGMQASEEKSITRLSNPSLDTEPMGSYDVAGSAIKKASAKANKVKDVVADVADSVKEGAQQVVQNAGSLSGMKDVDVPSQTRPSKERSKGAAYDADDALNVLLETYEMVVFSKTYCPHSKKAKAILEGYDIRPKPLIFELDVEEHGPQLQAALARLTNRKTVPNIVVHSTSLGGADELVALDKNDKLVGEIRALSTQIDITRKSKKDG